MKSEPNQPDSDVASNLFADYDKYAKVLRTWFVAYGVGGPVLLLTNEAVRDKITDSGLARCIAFAFLIGVVVQVLIALLNKTALWFCYKAERKPELRTRRHYRVANWFAYESWFEFGADLISLVAFGWATVRTFIILTDVGVSHRVVRCAFLSSMKSHLNSVGVAFTVIGAFLAWHFLGELNFVDKDEYRKGRGRLTIPDPTPDDIRKFNWNVRLSQFGIGLIALGGVIQILSNYWKMCP
jgi:hypothetical protein